MTKKVVCPERQCQKQIQDWELRSYLGASFEQLEKERDSEFFDNPNLVQCSCGNKMEFVQGQVDLNVKDASNMPITREAAECMARYRVRCPLSNCGKNFCTNPLCKAEPFHLGQTCQEHREFKVMKKCRFCFSKLTQSSPSLLPAFKEVCRSPDCISLMEKTCDKLKLCGHFCCGFRGE